MKDIKHTHNRHPQRSSAKQPSTSVDVGFLLEALVELSIARKNALIYPPEHEQVKKTTRKAFAAIQTLLSRQDEITLAVLKDSLSFEGKTLGSQNAALVELALILRQLELTAITFRQGLEERELVSFLRCLASDIPSRQPEKAGPDDIRKASFGHIRIQTMDYSRVRVTEETEIHKNGSDQTDASTWERFVTNLVGQDGSVQDGFSNRYYDPVVLAGIFNKHDVDPQKAVVEYDHLIGKHLETSRDTQTDTASLDRAFSYFNQLIHELNPELRQQFLTVTFDRCSTYDSEIAASQIMQGLGPEVTLEMLRYAKADGRQISPSLLRLIQKIGHMPGTDTGTRFQANTPSDGISTEAVQTLLHREALENYIDGDYDRVLGQACLGYNDFPDLGGLVLDLASGLEDRDVHCHMVHALSRLMAVSADASGYKDWARQLSLLIQDSVNLHAYRCLSDMWDFVQQEHQVQQDPEKRKVAGLAMNTFLSPYFISELIANIEKADPLYVEEALELLPRLGEAVVVEILDGMDGLEADAAQKSKMRLLTPFGRMAALEASRRLRDERPPYVCLMLRIIRRLGDKEIAEGTRLLLDSAHGDIAQEALSTLVKHGNPWGLVRLREMMGLPWSPEASKAIEMAGEHRVREMIPILTDFINRRGPVSSESERREAALRALGRIGDPACIPDLITFAKKKNPFGGKALAQLKKTLFESLEGYPFRHVESLIHMGLKLRDPEIEAICRDLLKRQYTKPRPLQPEKNESSSGMQHV